MNEQDNSLNHLVLPVYGDTDSVVDSVIHCQDGDFLLSQVFKESLDKYKIPTLTAHGAELLPCDKKVLNWDEQNGLHYTNIKYISRHKVTKKRWKLKTKIGEEIICTCDHSLIVFRDGKKLEVKPEDVLITDKILVITYNIFTIDESYIYDQIESIEPLAFLYGEYVYDIEVEDESHTFIVNNILVHNSLYLSYENLLKTIEGYEQMTVSDKCKILVDLNTKFLDKYNQEYIKKYYESRHAKSIHEFELETIALSGVWLDVKKRYAQILLWKDGKFFDQDDLPLKAKGLEIVKSSIPKQARGALKRIVQYFLQDTDPNFILQRLNIKMQEEKRLWMDADIEDVCGNVGVQNYSKYILDDTNKFGLKVAPKCPFNVRALGNYNWFKNVYNLAGDPLYGGKIKWYVSNPFGNKGSNDYFAFQSRNYPEWASKYAPINREQMFQKFVIDPFNRILEAIGMNTLNIDGSLRMSLFD